MGVRARVSGEARSSNRSTQNIIVGNASFLIHPSYCLFARSEENDAMHSSESTNIDRITVFIYIFVYSSTIGKNAGEQNIPTV